MWECCGETHLMSVNDFINTGMGGMAVGEMLYRTSSLLLDNTATGSERGWREFAGFLLNPVREVNRLLTGRATKAYENPSNRLDHKPSFLNPRINFGARSFSENSGFTDTETKVFANLEFQYGSPFTIERNKPFEFFLMNLQLNFGDKKGLGKLNIHGNLYYQDIGEPGPNTHRFMVLQHFDYVNNLAFEIGGQNVGAGIISNWELGEAGGWRLVTLGEGVFWPMVAVSSDFAYAAEIPGTRENLRSYDYGLGGGGQVGAALGNGRGFIFDVGYTANYVNTLNGSVTNGSDSWHVIQSVLVQLGIPLKNEWSVGADYELFLRNSHYSLSDFEDASQQSPQFRLFLSWSPDHAGPKGF
jgi:hypothetical protein